MTIVRDVVQDLIKKGMTLAQIKAADPAKEYRACYGSDSGFGPRTCSSRRIYKSLTQGRSKCDSRGKVSRKESARANCVRLDRWPLICGIPRRSRSGISVCVYGQRASAPTETDLTGYWVSVVTEDWRWRMVDPAKGDYQSVPSMKRAGKQRTVGSGKR